MTAIEDRLRAALHARTDQVTTLRPDLSPLARPHARTVTHPRLRKAAVVLLAAAVTVVLLMLPRLLSQDAPSAPADTPPPAAPSISTSPTPAPSPPDESPGPAAP
ncbi:hypothetical protein [Streptomyces venezuelae]|uniref:hypothetical protein n=1 Tax=Streptomyces venezuelae TaxID=54571 RepID=UPI00123BB4C2|nr:hypothetical protein [Streptomyces venezuelae]